MKLKEFETLGGRQKFYYVDPPLVVFAPDVCMKIRTLPSTEAQAQTQALGVNRPLRLRFTCR